MAGRSIRIQPDVVRTLAFGGISANYAAVGTAMTHPIRIIQIQNLTDTILMFSLNGIDDNVPLPTTGYMILDVSANKTNESGFFLSEGQRFYVRDMTAEGKAAASSGEVYITVWYGHQE